MAAYYDSSNEKKTIQQYRRVMATPCRKIGCAALVHSRYKGGYCEAHQSERTGWKRSKRSQHAGLTGRPWRRLRAEILHRDSYVCQPCHRQGKLTPATEVDHIVNLASGGDDSRDNLEAICTPCHKRKTFMESQKGSSNARYDYNL